MICIGQFWLLSTEIRLSFVAARFVPALQQTIYRTGVYRKALCQFFYANAFVVSFQINFRASLCSIVLTFFDSVIPLFAQKLKYCAVLLKIAIDSIWIEGSRDGSLSINETPELYGQVLIPINLTNEKSQQLFGFQCDDTYIRSLYQIADTDSVIYYPTDRPFTQHKFFIPRFRTKIFPPSLKSYLGEMAGVHKG